MDGSLAARVAAVRRFNRFYTQRIGVLAEGYVASRWTLAQVRVLYELAHRDGPTAAGLARDLGLDPGYLSRILRGFAREGLVARTRSARDGRESHVALTAKGRRVFAPIEARTSAQIAALLAPLVPEAQAQVVAAMCKVESVLAPAKRPGVVLRPHRPGDIGWLIERHGAIYAAEYGFDPTFEALVAEIGAKFLRTFDPARERAWIAEVDGVRVGAVLVVAKSRKVARLRLLLVEREARGLGIGAKLVDECIAFARGCGYRTLTLWTNDVLHAARAIYARAGFRLVHTEKHRSFGHDMVGETWNLAL